MRCGRFLVTLLATFAAVARASGGAETLAVGDTAPPLAVSAWIKGSAGSLPLAGKVSGHVWDVNRPAPNIGIGIACKTEQ